MNYEIRKLSDDIVAVLNASNVPIEAKRLVVKEVLSSVEAKANEIIKEEMKEICKEESTDAEGTQ